MKTILFTPTMVKFAKLLSKVVALLVMALMTVTCRDFDTPSQENKSEMLPNITIAELNRLIGDKALTISESLRIAGVVTSTDRESNFHKTFTIEDATGGVEIMAGIYGLHNVYPEGCYLCLELAECGVGRHYGVLQVGLPAKAYSGYPTDYFSSRVMLDRHIFCHNLISPIEPQRLTPAELDPTMCGRLVRIDGLTLTSHLHPEVWEVNREGTWHGYNFFSTTEGETIVVYTSDYATYADHTIPQGEVSISGILQYGKIDGEELFMIKMRQESDCSQNGL